MGTFTYENQGSNTFLVYMMDAEEQIDTLTEGMTSNNAIPGVLVPGFVQSNMERRLKYNISSKISLKQYFSGSIRKNQLFGILESLTTAMIMAEGYLLTDESFLLDEDFIFVDVGQKAGYLLAFPVEPGTDIRKEYYDFVRRMMFEMNFDETEDCAYVAALMNYINRKENFSLRGFLETIKRFERETAIRNTITGRVETQKSDTAEQNAPIGHQVEKPADSGQVAANHLFGRKPGESQEDGTAAKSKAGLQFPSLRAKKGSDEAGMQIPSAPAKQETGIPVKTGMQIPMTPAGQGTTVEAAKEREEKEKRSPLHSLFGKKTDAEKKERGKPGKNKGSVKRGMAFQIPGTAVTAENLQQSMTPQESVKVKSSYTEPQHSKRGQMDFGSTVIMGSEEDSVTVMAGSGIEEPEGDKLVTITRMKNGQTMVIEQEVFRLGKSSGYVDFYIGDNGTVSRSHADILMQNGGVYIRDNNSLNHTYVNGQMVRAGEQVGLSDGDRIRLSDEEFVIAVKNG